MISKSKRTMMTAEQIFRLPDDGNRYELVKAAAWLAAGTRIVLVADPAELVLRSYESTGQQTYGKGGIFNSGDVCSDWRLSVDDAFGSKE